MQTTILYILTAYKVVLRLSGFLRLVEFECSLYCYWTPLDQDLLISHVYIRTSMSKKSSVDCGSPSSRDSLMAKNHCSCAVVMWKKTQYYPLLLWTSLTRFSWPWSMWMLTAFFVTSKMYQLFFWQSTCTPLPCLRPAWLDYWVADHEVHFPGYCLFHSDRNRCGGGVAIYCAEICLVTSCVVVHLQMVMNSYGYLWSLVVSILLLLVVSISPFCCGIPVHCWSVWQYWEYDVVSQVRGGMWPLQHIDMLVLSKCHSKTL